MDDQPANPGKMSYEVVFDLVRHKSATRAALRSEWRSLIANACPPVCLCVCAGLIASGMTHRSGTDSWPYDGSLQALSASSGLGLVVTAVWYLAWWDHTSRALLGTVWHCEITDEVWSYAQSDGVRTAIPWSTMTIKMEHPEAWIIEYGNRKAKIFVYREPLRRAGLEEEFLKRLRGAK